MSAVEALLDAARELAHETGWDAERIARSAHLPPTAIAGIGRPDWDPSASVLRALEKLLVRRRKESLPRAVSSARRGGIFGFGPLKLGSFDWLADNYIRSLRSRGKRTISREHNRLLRHVLPAWTGLRVVEISERHVVILFDDLAKELSLATRSDVLRTVRHTFDRGVQLGLIANNPCRLLAVSPNPSPRRRVLHAEEIRELVHGLDRGSRWPQVRLALLWQLVTAQRIGAVIKARAADIDSGEREWVIPADHMKSGRSHPLPLSSLAFDLLSGINRQRGGNRLLFPSEQFRRQRPITHGVIRLSLAEATAGFSLGVTSHDLRRTAATRMIALGTSRMVVQKVLGHSDNRRDAAYDLHDYAEDMRDALERWGAFLVETVGEDVVARASAGWPAASTA